MIGGFGLIIYGGPLALMITVGFYMVIIMHHSEPEKSMQKNTSEIKKKVNFTKFVLNIFHKD